MFTGPYPRKLSEEELFIVNRILPVDRPGYKHYRDLINKFYLVGKGNSDNSFILSGDVNYLNSSPFVTHVFASGTFGFAGKEFNVVLHEEIDESVELEIDIDEIKDNPDVIYSEWKPGNTAPGDESKVREIPLPGIDFVLAIAPEQKKIWLYDKSSGVNFFIATGSFYSGLCIVKKIRDPQLVLKPLLLYTNLDNYTNNELISAFHLYNKSSRRFRIEVPVVPAPEKRKSFLNKLLKKDRS